MNSSGGWRLHVVALVLALPTCAACGGGSDSETAVDAGATPVPATSTHARMEHEVAPALDFTQTFFKAAPGERVHFTVRMDTGAVGDRDRWEWDFDGDGTTDLVTDVPESSHVYDEPFDGQVMVTHADAARRHGSAVAAVTIAAFAPEPPFAPTSVTATRADADLVVAWDADPSGVHRWVVMAEGQPIAAHDASARSIRVPDFPFGSVDSIAVAGLGKDGELGPKTSARVER